MIEWAVNDAADVINQSTSRRCDVNQLCVERAESKGPLWWDHPMRKEEEGKRYKREL